MKRDASTPATVRRHKRRGKDGGFITVTEKVLPAGENLESTKTLPLWATDEMFYKPKLLNSAIETSDIRFLDKFRETEIASRVIGKADKTGCTPLHMALLSGNVNVLACILSIAFKYIAPDDYASVRRHTPTCDVIKDDDKAPQSSLDCTMTEVLPLERTDTDIGDIRDDEIPRLSNIRLPNAVMSTRGSMNRNCDTKSMTVSVTDTGDYAEDVLSQSVIDILALFNRNLKNMPAIHLLLKPMGDNNTKEDAYSCLELLLSPYLENDQISPCIKNLITKYGLEPQKLEILDCNTIDDDGVKFSQRICERNYRKGIMLLQLSGLLPLREMLYYNIRSRELSDLFSLIDFQALEEDDYVNLLTECVMINAWKCFVRLLHRPLSDYELSILRLVASTEGNLDRLEFILLKIGTMCNSELSEIVNPTPLAEIFTHSDCNLHLKFEPVDYYRTAENVSLYPENPQRLDSLLHTDNGALIHDTRLKGIVVHTVDKRPVLADILRVHDGGYILDLKSKVKTASANDTGRVHIDDDTIITKDSWNSAMGACGCVMEAISAVVTGKMADGSKYNGRTAFCAIRPPGHHLGVYGGAQPTNHTGGLVDTTWSIGSQGFCLVNNIAVGAAWARYALSDYGINRIAIIDIDIHHGNGTENIVTALARTDRCLPTVSNLSYGVTVETFVNVPQLRVWRDETDAENVMFCSIHGWDGSFYPGTGYDSSTDSNLIINVPISKDMDEIQYLKVFEEKIIRPLTDFKPDLILVSAGFDGHKSDDVGRQFGHLTTKAYRTITRMLLAAANDLCNGRLVSVLEGGYNCLLGASSPFARCVVEHVDSLAFTSSTYTYNN